MSDENGNEQPIDEGAPFEHILFPRNPIHNDAGKLARFLADLKFGQIPPDVIELSKHITLDALGCIVAGSATPLGGKIIAAFETENAGPCSVPGARLRLPPSLAAKVNSWLSDVLDYEDYASGHPSATVVPAAFAIAEHLRSHPKMFLAGVVAGYEAGLRLHDATRASPDVYRQFAVYHAWHGFASGAAAMVVAGGSEEQFRSALGHAAANTNLPLWYVQYGRPSHALKANYGQMALGGVDAALCARQGIVGPFAMLSDKVRGFAKIIGSDQFEPRELSAGLANIWRTKDSCLKPYPCCAFLHTTIDAVAGIMNEHRVNYREVEKVEVRSFSRIVDWFSDKSPASDIDAQLSVEYACAMTLLGIEPGRGWYEPGLIASSNVAELLQRVVVELDPIAEREFWDNRVYLSSVTIHLKEGRKFCASVNVPRGHRRNRLSETEVVAKFLKNVHGTAIEPRSEQIADAVLRLESLTSLAEIGALLVTNNNDR